MWWPIRCEIIKFIVLIIVPGGKKTETLKLQKIDIKT